MAAGVGWPSAPRAAETGGPLTTSSRSRLPLGHAGARARPDGAASSTTRRGRRRRGAPPSAAPRSRRPAASSAAAASWRGLLRRRFRSGVRDPWSMLVALAGCRRRLEAQSGTQARYCLQARASSPSRLRACAHAAPLPRGRRCLSTYALAIAHRQLPHAQDVGRPLGDADAAAAVEDVEQVRALQAFLERRPAPAPRPAASGRTRSAARTDRDGAPRTLRR